MNGPHTGGRGLFAEAGDAMASRPSGSFRRADRLLDSRDFRRVSRKGRRLSGDAFVMLIAPPGPGCPDDSRRLGIAASRRVGNAVVRNRVKRSVREWFRRGRGRLPRDVDVVVIARRPASALDGRGISESLDALAARAAAPRPPTRSQSA